MTRLDAIDDDVIDGLLQTSTVFGGLEAAARAMLRAELELRTARRGETLIRQGDAADGMYIVGSGRLQVTVTTEDGTGVTVEVGRGELTGEMALLTDRPRSATVIALRDSHLLFLSTEGFGRLVHAHPQALRVISSALIDKLMLTIRRGSRTSPATTIAVVPLDASEPVHDFGAQLGRALASIVGSVRIVDAADARRELGDRSSALTRAVWREQLEANDAVIYVSEPSFDAWTDECTQHADLVVFAVSARGDRALRPVEHEVRRCYGAVAARTELVLLHQPSTSAPRGTRQWLAERDVQRHHHVRIDRPGDYERVARLLAGRGTGMVFSGGGARGIAHIGVLRAMAERKLSIDTVAGASVGSIVAGAVARGDSPDEVAAQLRAAVVEKSPVDITLPTVSFASGGRVTQKIKDGSDGLDLEDLWLNVLCVSTNLTRGSLEVHERGEAWAAVRASFSVPGLFPPMRNAAGDVLVDGGMLDNLPVTPLRARHSGLTVIASDVGARREFLPASLPRDGVVSGWRFVATSLRQRSPNNLTSLPRILMRLTELGSLGDDDRGDCYIRPALDGVSLLDFDKFDTLVDQGHAGAVSALDAWLAGPCEIDVRG